MIHFSKQFDMPHQKQELLFAFLTRLNKAAQIALPAGNEGCCPHYSYRFDPVLNRMEAWAYTCFKPVTLAVWDCNKRYDLQPVRFGNAMRYRLSSLNRFIDERLKPE